MSSSSIRRPKSKGILLDLGCGKSKKPGFTRMDRNKAVKPDIRWDLEKFPYPIPKESVVTMVASHIVEHITPKAMIDFMSELWRIDVEGCQLAASMPYGHSSGFLQEPTHCNACNETTWTYFDLKFPLYKVYEPKPWKIIFGPVYQANGNMEVILEKIKK